MEGLGFVDGSSMGSGGMKTYGAWLVGWKHVWMYFISVSTVTTWVISSVGFIFEQVFYVRAIEGKKRTEKVGER